ncbi:hypothetical protein BGX28_009607 [Mortierella sp. GBA30]|nr:hypothetical protein BGX28_009607 [Mortierella sp. GBA30]
MSVAPVIRWTQKKFNLDRPPGNAYMRRILEGRSSDMSKRKNVTLSDEQKRQVCKHKEQYPAISLPSLALWAKKQFCLVQAPSPQSISSALIRTGYGRTRHRCEYLKVEEENQIRERKIKCPNTNRHKLASWAQVQFNLGRPLSLKYLQSILEPLEDTPRRPRACLTAVQRRQLCQYKAQHPESTLPSLAIWAQKEFSLPHPPSLSGVHLILKVAGSTSKRRGEMVESDVDQDKDEEEDESSFGVKSRQRNRSNGSVVLERALAYFIVNHTIHRNIKPTLDDIMDKGQQFAEALGLGREDVSFSRTWFTSFYQRHGLTHGITNWNDKESVLIYLQVKELSVQKLLLMASKEYADGDSFDGQGALDETDVDEVSDIEDSDELHSVFSDIDVDMGDADDDDEQEDEQEVKQEDGQEVKQKDEQGVKEDAKDEQDVEMKFEARETGGPHAWSLKEKIRALFVVIPLLDPFDAQQKEAYTVLNDLYIRFQILGLKQEPIDATAGDWTREKRESLSIIMALLDPSVESHRSTYTILNQENEKLSCGE